MAQLNLAVAHATGPYDLAALGPLDWFIYPGSTSIVKKSGTSYLTVGPYGTGFTDLAYTGGPTISWAGGAPTASGSSTGGVFTYNNGNLMPVGVGYVVTAPADTTVRTLRILAGNYSCALRIDVSLSDNSSPAQMDNTTLVAASVNTGGNGYIEIQYAAASAGQTLTVVLTLDSQSFSNRNISISAAALSGTAPSSGGITVSGVTVTPGTATVAGGGQQQFSASVAGTNSPSQAVTWTTSAGTISSTGLLTAPLGTASAQTVTVTAKSVQDGSKTGTATVTIPATTLVLRTVTISMDIAKDTPAANLTGAKVAFYDEPTPDLYGTVRFQSGSETFDAAGVMTFTCQTQLSPGQSGGIAIYFPDGKNYVGQAMVS